MGLLKLILLKLLNVQHDTFSLTGRGQKALELPDSAYRLFDQSLRLGTQGQSTDLQLHLPVLPHFRLLGSMLKNQIKSG